MQYEEDLFYWPWRQWAKNSISDSKKNHQSHGADEYLFTYIDTDNRTLQWINREENLVNRCDYVDLGETNPYRLYMQAKVSHDEKTKRLLEWAIPSYQYPNQKLADGAQAIRMIGRLGFYKEEQIIKRELTRKLQQFQGMVDENGSPVVPDVWVVASSCGGTGSAIVLDILYLIDRIVQFDLGYGMSPDVKLVLYMPKPFIEANYGNNQFYQNAFATLWEINAFRAAYLEDSHVDKYGPYAATPPSVTWNTNVGFPLFKYVIPIDAESDNNTIIPLDDLYPTVAELVYYLTLGSGAHTMISNLSNDARLLNTAFSHYDDTRCDWMTSLIAFGYKVFRKPNDELKRYLKTRGMLELVKYGLLGKETPADASEMEKAKIDFATKHILPFLLDTNWCQANCDSLQSRISKIYNSAFHLNVNDLTLSVVSNLILQVENVANNFEDIENEVLEDIKKQINEGTSDAIHSHGLNDAWTLLHLVDEYFLENDVNNVLISQLNELFNLVEAKKSEVLSLCENVEKFPAFLFGRKDKREQCVALFNEYKQYVMQYHTLRSALNIIQKLTRRSPGYLEMLRRGSSDNVGLRQLIDLARCAQSKLEEDYKILHEEFCDSVKNYWCPIKN